MDEVRESVSVRRTDEVLESSQWMKNG